MTLSAYEAAAKAWRNRNSDFQNSWHDRGHSDDPTHAPPGFTEVAYEADTTTFAGLLFPTGRLTPDEDGETAHAVVHAHLYDPTLTDPD